MRTILPTILTAGLLMSGCSFLVGEKGKPCGDVEDCDGKPCVDGVCTDEQTCTDECDFEGQVDCDPYAPIIVTCSRNADTCLNWIPNEDCGGENKCVEGDPPTCQPGCDDMCELDRLECVQGSSAICIDGQYGCRVWYEAVDCEQNGKICQAGRCFGAQGTCDDQVRNQDETDVDCGGTACEPCIDGKTCHYDVDCASEDCLQGTCSGDPTCTDGVMNQGETDVDCGGPNCDGCANGLSCTAGNDCLSANCANGTCLAPPTCDDSIKNQDETDTDCGGGTCPPCADGLSCNLDRDCQSGTCTGDICEQADHCSDGQTNFDETDQDCGGSCGATCTISQTCLSDGDCLSGYCPVDSCQQPPLSRRIDIPMMDSQQDDALAVDFLSIDGSGGDHYLATGSSHGRPRVWMVPGDPGTPATEIPTDDANLEHGPDEVGSVVFQRGGQDGEDYLFTSDAIRGVYRIRVSTWVRRTFQSIGGSVLATTPGSGAFIAAGDHIGGAGANQIDIWDGTSDGGYDQELAILDLGAQVHSLAFSPTTLGPGGASGFYLAAGSEGPVGASPGLKVWHSSDWTAYPNELAQGIPVLDVAFSPSADLLGYVYDHPDNPTHLGIIDLSNWNSIAGIEIADLTSIAFVPGKPLAFAATSFGVVFPVCDRGSGWQERSPIDLGEPDPIYDLAVSSDGKWLAVGGEGRVLVFSVSRLAEENGCDDL